MIKDANIILSAYNDKSGITKDFNKNILKVINKKYNLDFDLTNYDHQAEFNSRKSQIEMYLRSNKDHSVTDYSNSFDLKIKSGEKILTEISRKFSPDILNSLFSDAELKVVKKYNDQNSFYNLYLLRRG